MRNHLDAGLLTKLAPGLQQGRFTDSRSKSEIHPQGVDIHKVIRLYTPRFPQLTYSKVSATSAATGESTNVSSTCSAALWGESPRGRPRRSFLFGDFFGDPRPFFFGEAFFLHFTSRPCPYQSSGCTSSASYWRVSIRPISRWT